MTQTARTKPRKLSTSSSTIKVLDNNDWRVRRLHPCQAETYSPWYYRKYGYMPKCKHSAVYGYRGKELCMLHLGQTLIKEKLNGQRS